jgi:hypothetical protein
MVGILAAAGFAVAVAQQTAQAGVPDRPLTITATVGRSSTWDDEGNIGAGLSAGAGAEWRLNPRWSIGFRVERLDHERRFGGDLRVIEGRTVVAVGELTYRFRDAGVVPFVVGGYGALWYSGTLTDSSSSPVTLRRTSQSDTAVAGGGIEISIGKRMVLVPEVKLYFCQPRDDFAPWIATRAGLSVGWRF